jgi:hypothetical protein
MTSLFAMMNLELKCPHYSVLSKRLSELKIASPRYKKTSNQEDNTVAIAIDSTGLKPHDRNEGVEMSGTRKNTGYPAKEAGENCTWVWVMIILFIQPS